MSSSKILAIDDTHMIALGVLLTQLQSFRFFISSPLCRATAAIDKPKDMKGRGERERERFFDGYWLGIFANILLQSTHRTI